MSHVIENKIRVLALLNMGLVAVYQSVTWENTNASFIHGLHVGTDALAILATLLQQRSIVGVCTLIQGGMLAVDAIITALTLIMINRCLVETSSCTTRFAEGAVWALLGGLHCLVTVFQISQLYRYFYTSVPAQNHTLRQRNAHLLKVAPVLAYLLLGAPAGSDVLVVAHLAFDCAGIYSTFSLVNYGSIFAVGSLLALGLDALLLTKRESGYQGELKVYTVLYLLACDVALLIFSSKRAYS